MTSYWMCFCLLVTSLCFSSCQWGDDLPDEFLEVSRCEFTSDATKVLFRGERNLNCDTVKENLEVARSFYEGMGYPWNFKDLRVDVWNRQILYCDQWFIGICVHSVKGSTPGAPKRGWEVSAFQSIDLNDGGELLLHELFHWESDQPNHERWWYDGKAGMDRTYRAHHRSLR